MIMMMMMMMCNDLMCTQELTKMPKLKATYRRKTKKKQPESVESVRWMVGGIVKKMGFESGVEVRRMKDKVVMKEMTK